MISYRTNRTAGWAKNRTFSNFVTLVYILMYDSVSYIKLFSYTEIAQRIFKCGEICDIPTVYSVDEELNSLIDETFYRVNIYGSYKLLKTVRLFARHVKCFFVFCPPYILPPIHFAPKLPHFLTVRSATDNTLCWSTVD